MKRGRWDITELWCKDRPHEEMVPHEDSHGAEEEDASAPGVRDTQRREAKMAMVNFPSCKTQNRS